MNTPAGNAVPIELLPCPFCGGAAKLKPDEVGSGGQHVPPYHVGCFVCGVVFSDDDFINPQSTWNTRCKRSDHLLMEEAANTILNRTSFDEDSDAERNDTKRLIVDAILEYDLARTPLAETALRDAKDYRPVTIEDAEKAADAYDSAFKPLPPRMLAALQSISAMVPVAIARDPRGSGEEAGNGR